MTFVALGTLSCLNLIPKDMLMSLLPLPVLPSSFTSSQFDLAVIVISKLLAFSPYFDVEFISLLESMVLTLTSFSLKNVQQTNYILATNIQPILDAENRTRHLQPQQHRHSYTHNPRSGPSAKALYNGVADTLYYYLTFLSHLSLYFLPVCFRHLTCSAISEMFLCASLSHFPSHFSLSRCPVHISRTYTIATNVYPALFLSFPTQACTWRALYFD